MSPCTNESRSCAITSARFSRFPAYVSASSETTSYGVAASRWRTKFDEMNPAPPVTSTRLLMSMLEEALRLKAAHPEARPIQGGTDVMVELTFGHSRPDALLDLSELAELRGFTEEDGVLRLGSGLTYTEAMQAPLTARLPALAEASRTVGSPQIRNRGTIGSNVGTGSPAGDGTAASPGGRAEVELANVRGTRTLPLEDFLLGVKRTALAGDELVTAVRITPSGGAQTFAKVGPRNAMVIAICSLAVVVDTAEGEVRAAFGSAAVTAKRVTVPLADAAELPDRIAEAAAPIDDVRATADYRRHALRVLASRTLRKVPPLVRVSLTVNGERLEGDAWGGESLLTFLRDTLELPGSKNACEQGECGSCSVLFDGTLVCSCLVLAAQAEGTRSSPSKASPAGTRCIPVQQAFVDAGAVKCGFCTPGLVVAVADLLDRVPHPSDDEIHESLSGNLCRCTGYTKVFDAVRIAAERA